MLGLMIFYRFSSQTFPYNIYKKDMRKLQTITKKDVLQTSIYYQNNRINDQSFLHRCNNQSKQLRNEQVLNSSSSYFLNKNNILIPPTYQKPKLGSPCDIDNKNNIYSRSSTKLLKQDTSHLYSNLNIPYKNLNQSDNQLNEEKRNIVYLPSLKNVNQDRFPDEKYLSKYESSQNKSNFKTNHYQNMQQKCFNKLKERLNEQERKETSQPRPQTSCISKNKCNAYNIVKINQKPKLSGIYPPILTEKQTINLDNKQFNSKMIVDSCEQHNKNYNIHKNYKNKIPNKYKITQSKQHSIQKKSPIQYNKKSILLQKIKERKPYQTQQKPVQQSIFLKITEIERIVPAEQQQISRESHIKVSAVKQPQQQIQQSSGYQNKKQFFEHLQQQQSQLQNQFSELKQPQVSNYKPQNPQWLCEICLLKQNQQKLIELICCNGNICNQCLIFHIKNQINRIKVPTCAFDCGQYIENKQIDHSILTEIQKQNLYRANFERVVFEDSLKKCKRQKCKEGILVWVKDAYGKQILRCVSCQVRYCSNCFAEEHEGKCDLNLLILLLETQNFGYCFGCNSTIYRYGGCKHMKCNCKYEFCLFCSEKWTNYNHQCPQISQNKKILKIIELKQQIQKQDETKKQKATEFQEFKTLFKATIQNICDFFQNPQTPETTWSESIDPNINNLKLRFKKHIFNFETDFRPAIQLKEKKLPNKYLKKVEDINFVGKYLNKYLHELPHLKSIQFASDSEKLMNLKQIIENKIQQRVQIKQKNKQEFTRSMKKIEGEVKKLQVGSKQMRWQQQIEML